MYICVCIYLTVHSQLGGVVEHTECPGARVVAPAPAQGSETGQHWMNLCVVIDYSTQGLSVCVRSTLDDCLPHTILTVVAIAQ